MCEGLVGLSHAMNILALLDRGTLVVRSIEKLAGKTLGHRLLSAGTGSVNEPAHCQRVAAGRTYLDRDLVGRAAYTAGLDLYRRTNMIKSLFEDCKVLLAALLGNNVESSVYDALGNRLLAVNHNYVDELGEKL